MTIGQARINIISILKKNNINRPNLESELLLSFVLQKPNSYILTYPEKNITNKKFNLAKKLALKRITHTPLAYIVGSKEFFGLDFNVNKHTLIPRPETELLVENILNYLKTVQAKNKIILTDIGTGSGCIIISILKNIRNNLNITAVANDISSGALEIAKTNALKYGLEKNISFLKGHEMLPLLKKYNLDNFNTLLVSANLPYLTNKQIKSSKSIKKEPKKALYGGIKGLKYYQRLLRQLQTTKQQYQQLKIIAWLEIDDTQRADILQLAKKIAPEARIEVKKDLGNYDRLVYISL